MAETRTAIQIAYKASGSETVAAELDSLISKARQLQNILANVNVGAGGGAPPSAGGGTTGGSSLNSSLAMAHTAQGGNTSSVVTGGSSTQGGGNQSNAAQGIQERVPRSWDEAGLQAKVNNWKRPGLYDVPSRATDLQGAPDDTLFDTSYKPRNRFNSLSSLGLSSEELAAYQASQQKPGVGNKIGRMMTGRGGYAAMMGIGLGMHAATSKYAEYWSSMYSAAPVETAGQYSGNYFQMLQSQTEAQQIRQSAEMRAGWAYPQVGSTILGSAGMAAPFLIGGLPGIGVGLAAMGGSALLNMYSSKGQSREQSDIDTAVARRMAAIRTAQQRQATSVQAVSTIAGSIPFGLRGTGRVDEMTRAGLGYGYDINETYGMVNRFNQAGGNFNSSLITQMPGMARYGNINPESLGAIEKTFTSGGGSGKYTTFTSRTSLNTEQFVSGDQVYNSLQYANAAGIDASRRNEWLQRRAAFSARYAEQGITTDPVSAELILGKYAPANLKGLQPMAYAENIQQFGMGVAGELSESMMPARLSQALMMQKAISLGGGPMDWYNRLSSPRTTAAMGASLEGSLPDMLKPFFASQVTGLAPNSGTTLLGPGITRVANMPGQGPIPQGGEKTGNEAVDNTMSVLVKTAEANNRYLQAWQDTIKLAAKQLVEVQTAIQNAKGEFLRAGIPFAD